MTEMYQRKNTQHPIKFRPAGSSPAVHSPTTVVSTTSILYIEKTAAWLSNEFYQYPYAK